MAASNLLHHLLRPPLPLLFLRATTTTTTTTTVSGTVSTSKFSLRLQTPTLSFSSSPSLPRAVAIEHNTVSALTPPPEEPEAEISGSESEKEAHSPAPEPYTICTDPKPELTMKEKKELCSYAHGLGKKLKIQQVGKSGVTASVATSLLETLEANELLKIKIQPSCPGEIYEVVKQLEDATASLAIGQIGRTVILYRPSLSKLKEEEKKRQARRVFVRKETAFIPTVLRKAQALSQYEHVGRRERRKVRGSNS